MIDKRIVWVVEGYSEWSRWSALFSRQPTHYTKKRLAFKWDGDVDNPTDGGYAGSRVTIDVYSRMVDED